METIRELQSIKRSFVWLPEHQVAFEKLKEIICKEDGPVLAFYDAERPVELHTDASRTGLGYALLQPDRTGKTRLISCSSRFLSKAEDNYAVCELEALAIQYAIQKCDLYLSGRHFDVFTDHKPLVSIFKKKNISEIDNKRLQRILSKLTGYSFTVKWVAGSTNAIADALSRQPLFAAESNTDILEEEVTVRKLQVYEDPALEKFQVEAKSDPNYQLVMAALTAGKDPKNLPPGHPGQLFTSVWDELSKDGDLMIYQSTRIVVPKSLRKEVLQTMHVQHQGIGKTRELANELYWWPGISNEIKQMISQCETCAVFKPSQQRETLQQSSASRPMEAISTDLAQEFGKHFLITVDRYSGYPFVDELKRLDTSAVTDELEDKFLDYGNPNAIRSDDGPQFRSEFNEYCDERDITHELSSAHNPTSNGHAERAVRSMKDLLRKCGGDMKKFRYALREWRNTPQANGLLSPSKLFFGRRQRTATVAHNSAYDRVNDSTIQRHEARREENMDKAKSNFDKHAKDLPKLDTGDRVRVQDWHVNSKGHWLFTGTILYRTKNGRSYRIQLDDSSRPMWRNRKFLRPLNSPEDDQSAPALEDTLPATSMTAQGDQPKQAPASPRRSTRNRKRVVKFDEHQN